MSTSNKSAPVIIVGAGPTGLATGIALRARGIKAIILESDSRDRNRSGTRAIYIHGSTLHRLEQIHPGVGQKIAQKGLVWPTRRTLWRGNEIFSRTYSDPGGTGNLPHFTSLPQSTTESFLRESFNLQGGTIHWSSEVEHVEPQQDGVRVQTVDGDVWRTEYLVGADGAGSTVRNGINADFQGEASENSFIVIDIEETPETPREVERVFHYSHPDVGGRNVLIIPFTGGWRIDIQCKQSDDPSNVENVDVASEMVATILGERYRSRISWISRYTFKQVTADSFVDAHQRILLAGEAAHLFAPFGARGMNSGIADADEAASAITVAITAETASIAEAEIKRYGTRRKKAAEYNKYAAGKALEHLQSNRLTTKIKKTAAAKLSRYWEGAGEWLDDAPYGPRKNPDATQFY